MYFLCGIKKKQKMIKPESSCNSNNNSQNKTKENSSTKETSEGSNDDEKEDDEEECLTVYTVLMQNFAGTSHQDVFLDKNHHVLIGVTEEEAIEQANKMFYDWIFARAAEYCDNDEEVKKLEKKFKLEDIDTYKDYFFAELFHPDGLPCMYDSFASLLVYEWNLDEDDNEESEKTLVHQIPYNCKTA